MCKKCGNITHRENPENEVFGRSLDTLAQLGTKPQDEPQNRTPKTKQELKTAAAKARTEKVKSEIAEVLDYFPELKGKTHISQRETLIKRANRNYLKTNLAKGLIIYTQAKAQHEENDRKENYHRATPADIRPKMEVCNPFDLLFTVLNQFEKAEKQTEKADIKKPLKYYQEKNECSIIKNTDLEKLPESRPLKFYNPAPTLSPNRRKAGAIKEHEEDKFLLKSFRNMYYCNSEMTVKPSGQVVTSYCKNRLCLVCNAIRTSVLIEKYKTVFSSWKGGAYFVTLTIKNCTESNLSNTIDFIQKSFNQCKDRIKKQNKRDEKQNFEGVRKMECTSIRDNDYHPHYHLIVKGKENAENLVKYWLETTNKRQDGKSLDKCQDIRPADDNSIKELFKYFTKIVSSKQEDEKIYLDRNYNIFKAMRGRRIFQNFGFKIADYNENPEENNAPTPPPEELDEVANFEMTSDIQEVKEVEKIYLNYEIYSEKDGAATLELYENLKTYQADKEAVFNGFQDENTTEKIKEITENIESSKDCLNAILEVSILQINTYKVNIEYLRSADEPPPELLDSQYIFNSSVGNWYGKHTGEELIFNYSASDSLKELVDKMFYPTYLRNEIINYLNCIT